MAGFVPDTSCMVAAVCAWHEHHTDAVGEINRRLMAKEPMLLAAPALIEAYAVLTRLPPPHRLSAVDALALLEASFVSAGKIVALDAASYRSLVRQAATDGIVGGRVYDAVNMEAGSKREKMRRVEGEQGHRLPFGRAPRDVPPPSLLPKSCGGLKDGSGRRASR